MKSQVNVVWSKLSYRYNRFCQEIGNIVGAPMGKPSEVWLKLTHRCKTQCVMCNIWKTPSRPSDELSTEQWKTVLDDLRSWLGPYDVWFTGGEAFARKDVVELFSHSTKLGLASRVITRGVGVYDEPTARAIISSGLNEYHVSIEALKPELHDSVSPPKGSFAKAVAGIDWLNKLRKSEGSRLRIVIKTIIMGLNRAEILPIVEWVMANNFDEIKFQPLEQTIEEEKDIHWFKRNNLWPQDVPAVNEVVHAIEELVRLKGAGVPIHNSEQELLNMKRYFLDPLGMYEPVKKHVLSTTGTTRETNDGWLEIWHNGDARTSWRNPPLGNVTERPIWEIWKSRSRPPKAVRVFGLLR